MLPALPLALLPAHGLDHPAECRGNRAAFRQVAVADGGIALAVPDFEDLHAFSADSHAGSFLMRSRAIP